MAQRFAEIAHAARSELAGRLGVTTESLTALGVGWNCVKQYWSLPERNAAGTIIGITARHMDGQKKRLQGSKAGLTYAEGWDAGTRSIFLVEGASDTAALLGIELNVVGRPSNNGGVDLLIELLADIPNDREIIVIGERDEKSNGRWPGKEGAVRTAQRLAEHLDRPIGWALPPDAAKDARDWLRVMPTMPIDRLAALFVSGLETSFIQPPPRFTCRIDNRREIPLSEWRDEMLRLRLASLESPGFYLDASATGAGKSHVDYRVVLHSLGSEAA